jgi:hypothetical protein
MTEKQLIQIIIENVDTEWTNIFENDNDDYEVQTHRLFLLLGRLHACTDELKRLYRVHPHIKQETDNANH